MVIFQCETLLPNQWENTDSQSRAFKLQQRDSRSIPFTLSQISTSLLDTLSARGFAGRWSYQLNCILLNRSFFATFKTRLQKFLASFLWVSFFLELFSMNVDSVSLIQQFYVMTDFFYLDLAFEVLPFASTMLRERADLLQEIFDFWSFSAWPIKIESLIYRPESQLDCDEEVLVITIQLLVTV